VCVEYDRGEKRFPTLARSAEMLPVRGKGKTIIIIPSPQNRPTIHVMLIRTPFATDDRSKSHVQLTTNAVLHMPRTFFI
jgi:hypothetical protein